MHEPKSKKVRDLRTLRGMPIVKKTDVPRALQLI